MTPTVVYHWWASPADAPPYANLRAPIVISIATLRAVNPTIPIFVMDFSQIRQDWGHFQKKLGFELIVNNQFALQRYKGTPGWMHLSRLFDLEQFDGPIIYCDSDVFWFSDPLPLACSTDRFCFNGHNTGLFYYDRSERLLSSFFELFKAYTIASLNCGPVREIMKSYVGYNSWHYVFDEMICTYMFREHRNLFHQIPVEEHMTTATLSPEIIPKIKAFHCNGTMVANEVAKNEGEKEHSRGLLGLIFTELYEGLKTVLDEHDLKMVYTHQELARYLPQQFSINQIRRLVNTKSPDGHYHLAKCLKQVPIF